jgi:hypothetical protein
VTSGGCRECPHNGAMSLTGQVRRCRSPENRRSPADTLAGIRGITPRIARRGIAHGSGLGRHRWVVERGFAWLHAFKRLRTRYERRADIHLGLLRLACALICYRQLPVVLE